MANVNSDGGVRARPKTPKRPPTALTGALAGQQGGGMNAPAVQPPSLVDLSMDPILQQIQAANLSNVQGAQANELAGRKQALIDYGSEPGLEGLFPDQSTQEAAKGNPFSVLANLLYAHQQDARGIDEGLNQQNLFYSSEHDRQNQDEQHHYQQGRSAAYGGLRSQLGGLGAALLAAQSNAASSNQQGLADAFGRYTPPATPTPPAGPGIGPSLAGVPGAERGLRGDVIHGLPLVDPLTDVQSGSRLGLRRRTP
jgi:hypothetical protein